jgi:hypothetical protein
MDDPPEAPFGHAGPEPLSQQVGRLQVHCHSGVPHILAQLAHRRPQVDPGAVDEDVGLPERLGCLLGRRAHTVAGAQVGAHPGRPAAVGRQLTDRGGQLRFPTRHDQDACPCQREGPGDGSTDSRTTASHYCYPAVQREQLGEVGLRGHACTLNGVPAAFASRAAPSRSR